MKEFFITVGYLTLWFFLFFIVLSVLDQIVKIIINKISSQKPKTTVKTLIEHSIWDKD